MRFKIIIGDPIFAAGFAFTSEVGVISLFGLEIFLWERVL